MTEDTALLILAELRALPSAIAEAIAAERRRCPGAPALIAALEAEFGPGRFTVDGVVSAATDGFSDALAAALEDCVDMNASPRAVATAVGVLLRKLPELEAVAEQRGARVYRLRT